MPEVGPVMMAYAGRSPFWKLLICQQGQGIVRNWRKGLQSLGRRGGDFGGRYVDARDEDAVEEGEEGECVVNERDSSKGQENEGKVCREAN